MKKLVVLAAGALAAIAAGLALFSAGVAGAVPDVSGQSFSEAQAALKAAGYQAVVSTSFGSGEAQGDCTVVRQETTMATPFIGGDVTAPSSTQKVLLSLDCSTKPKTTSTASTASTASSSAGSGG